MLNKYILWGVWNEDLTSGWTEFFRIYASSENIKISSEKGVTDGKSFYLEYSNFKWGVLKWSIYIPFFINISDAMGWVW